MTTYICPHVNDCIIYKNWVQESGDDRINVINYNLGKFECLDFMSLEDPVTEGGVIFSEEVKKRVKDLGVEKNIGIRDTKCSHISLLNLLNSLSKEGALIKL